MLLTAFERPSAAAIELNSWVVGLSLPVKTRDGGNDQEMTVDTTEATYYRRRVARSCRPGLRAGHWCTLSEVIQMIRALSSKEFDAGVLLAFNAVEIAEHCAVDMMKIYGCGLVAG